MKSEPVRLSEIQPHEVMPGFAAKMIHTAQTTHAYWQITKGAALPEHAHVHEQVLNLLEGEFELVLAGVPHRLMAGDVLVIPSNVPHSGTAITDCRILDVFSPVREDYR